MNPLATAAASAIGAARRCPKAFARWMGYTCDGFHAELQDLWTEHDRSVCYAPVGSGKSWQQVLRLVWDLGKDPDARVAIISATEGLGTNIVSTLRTFIKDDLRVRAVFSDLQMSESQALDTTDGFRLERPSRGPDPSVKVYGVGAGEIQGSRLTHVVADDVSTFANSLTEASRDKLVHWFQSAVLTRAAVEGLQVRILANPHHRSALPEIASKWDGWALLRRGAEDDAGRLLVPDLSSKTQLAKKRRELGSFAAAMVDAQTPAAGRSMFSGEGIDRCLRGGEGLTLVRSFPPGAAQVFSGVDISGGVGRDRSAIVTVAVLDDGSRRPLDVRSSDRWNGTQLVDQMRQVHRAYGGIFGVESNATQGLIADIANDVPTVSITTTQQLKRYGMLGLATEVDNGNWLFPSVGGEPCGGELRQLIAEMLSYTASSHAGDRLMATLMAREVAVRSFDVLEDHSGAEKAADDLLAMHGIYDNSPEARWARGDSAWCPIDTLERWS